MRFLKSFKGMTNVWMKVHERNNFYCYFFDVCFSVPGMTTLDEGKVRIKVVTFWSLELLEAGFPEATMLDDANIFYVQSKTGDAKKMQENDDILMKNHVFCSFCNRHLRAGRGQKLDFS